MAYTNVGMEQIYGNVPVAPNYNNIYAFEELIIAVTIYFPLFIVVMYFYEILK